MRIEPPHPDSIPATLAGAVVATVAAAVQVGFWVVWPDDVVWWTQGPVTLIFVVWAVYFWWRYTRLRRDRDRGAGSFPSE
ncbi:hypothetical protein [Amycolatopsis sacchari]|uniref:hypothetical protein n=1 Tax=Amycolatopsis sacchari TaxID=115433 RepID=UPI003D73C299